MAVLPFDEEQIRTYREYRRQYGWVYRVVGGLLLILFGIWLGSQLFAGDNGYQTNLYTEALSIAVTVFVLNELAKRRDAQKWFAQLRRQMGSNDHGLTQQAVRELAATNWMYDGSLRGCYFTSANLEDATMLHADLEATYFTGANLRGASLPYAKLQKARLQFADFEGATL
jgi:uncharacterized protein YjbI with pentapeptide repeats